MTSFHDKTEIWRQGTSIAGAGGLVVRIWTRHVVSKLSWPHVHQPLIIRPIFVLDRLCHSFHFVRGVGYTDEVAPGDSVERVACGADFAVDLITSPDATTRVMRNYFEARKTNNRRTLRGQTCLVNHCGTRGTGQGGGLLLHPSLRSLLRGKVACRRDACTSLLIQR